MDKKELIRDRNKQTPSRPWDGHLRIYLAFLICAMAICTGLVGYFIGGATSKCGGTAANVDGASSEILERTFRISTANDDKSVADMEINVEPSAGDCVCTSSNGVALFREAELSSGILGVLKKDQCFRLLRSFRWQADGLIFYWLKDPENNQTGWAVSSHLRRSKHCELPLVLSDNVDSNAGYAGGWVSQQCLQCMCQLESGCRPLGCRMDVGSLSCGYFQIKAAYYKDCGKPGKDLLSCGKDKYCSSLCVQTYMRRYVPGSRCKMTCETFAREHNGGPRGCRNPNTLSYWKRLTRIRGCNNPPINAQN